jgi:hypothetical protein
MKAFKGIPLWACILGALLLANLAWISWNLHHYTDIRTAGKHFRMEVLHTNDASGVGLFLMNTGQEQPLWTEFNFGDNGSQSDYYFRGQDVFGITVSSNMPPRYNVLFRGPGKSVTWWLDRRGSGAFTERIFYDTNGITARHEVWYDNTWQLVDRRNGKNGLIITGEWSQLAFGTNGTWAIGTVPGGHL